MPIAVLKDELNFEIFDLLNPFDQLDSMQRE